MEDTVRREWGEVGCCREGGGGKRKKQVTQGQKEAEKSVKKDESRQTGCVRRLKSARRCHFRPLLLTCLIIIMANLLASMAQVKSKVLNNATVLHTDASITCFVVVPLLAY